ncbi:MAG: DUF2975 domain-containing protein [Chloroflexota bacterium]
MNIEHRSVILLKAVMAALFLVLLVFQFLSFPGQFAYNSQQHPDQAYLQWPLTFLAGFCILCAQVIVVSIWRLLSLVQSDRIFSNEAFKWVSAIIWAIAGGWTVLVSFTAWVLSQADDPGMPMVLIFLSLAVTVVGLLMVVMRALLRQATLLRSDLEGVI